MNTKLCLGLISIASASASLGSDAVSKLNGKLDASYGSFNSAKGWTAEGSVAMPIVKALGFQFDALYADVEGIEFSGVGGHLFWRDNQIGLLGLSLGGVFGEKVDSYELSVEGEYYLNWVTFGAKAGYAVIEYDHDVPFIDTNKNGAFGLVYATVYPIDDLSVSIGFEHRFDNSSLRLDAEYELPMNGLSLFARTMVADHSYNHVLFGLRYYFGAEKSLKQRHRQDDPRSVVQDLLFGVGTYGAEYNKRGKRFVREHGGSGSFGNYGSSDYGSSWQYGGFHPIDLNDLIVVGPDSHP